MPYDYKKDLTDVVKKYMSENANKYDLSDPEKATNDIWEDVFDKIMRREPGYVAPDETSARQWASENMPLLLDACDYDEEYAQDTLDSEPEYADMLIRTDVSFDVIHEMLLCV